MIEMGNNLPPAMLAGLAKPAPTGSRAASAASLHGFRLDHARSAGDQPKDELRELTELVVSTTFITPMFEQLRNDPLASEMFHGGRGEKVFQQQLDQIYSDRMAQTASFGLADALYRQFAPPTAGQALNTHG